MAKTPPWTAGLLLFRRRRAGVEVLLAHPGGPFWTKRDLGAWSLPKGQADAGEDALGTACREFEEETGVKPRGPFLPLDAARVKLNPAQAEFIGRLEMKLAEQGRG